jgi:hypothetical protein
VIDESEAQEAKHWDGSTVTRGGTVNETIEQQPSKHLSPILLILSCRVSDESEVHPLKQL